MAEDILKSAPTGEEIEPCRCGDQGDASAPQPKDSQSADGRIGSEPVGSKPVGPELADAEPDESELSDAELLHSRMFEDACAEADSGSPDESEASEGPKAPATIEDWQAEARRFQDLYLRTLADTENARRRFQKDREDTLRYSTENVLRGIIPFLDNLNLALSYADLDIPAVKNLAEGVRMTLKGCLDSLSEYGLKEIAPQPGQTFDPNFHEAIGQEPSELPDKSISRLVSKGYALHQRLLKPAKVMVAKNEATN
ncbi:MAG: nucleotide exchange factor GrpE [Deltaproteobacteria bacterium]|jgi:molecular chaperone GrpE|nr:nucleotide exchange factor GrpE [Deltaproteobacteria bacterium]